MSESSIDDEIFKILDQKFCPTLQSSLDVPTQHQIAKRRHFGFGLLLISIFCLGIAVISSLDKAGADTVVWVIYALILLIVGAWQIDKAAKDEQRSSDLLNEISQPKTKRSKQFSPTLVK